MVSTNDCFHLRGSHENFDYMALAELHLHLEGTVDRETLMLLDPTLSPELVADVWRFSDFAGFIECFKFIAQRLRTPDDYALVTRRMLDRLQRHGITYAEVTLAAGVVLWRGLNFDDVWRAVRQAQNGSAVEVWWNLDAIRHFGADHVLAVARLAAHHIDDGVVSFGIGGDEKRGPATAFGGAFRYAKGAGLHLTAHAGEMDGPESIWAALDIGAERIGHGIRAVEDLELMRHLAERQIPLEICITSNVRTGAIATLEQHPIRQLFDAGVPLTLNSDDPGMFETNLGREFLLAREVFGFEPSELEEIRANALRYRFRGRSG